MEGYSVGMSSPLDKNDTLKVVFDGVIYVLECSNTDDSTLYFGDQAFAETPFYLELSRSTYVYSLYIYFQDATSHTVEVFVQNGVNVVKIPAEYIPEMSTSALKLYLAYGDYRFFLDKAHTSVATKERIAEAFNKGESILIYNQDGYINDAVRQVMYSGDKLMLETDETTYTIAYDSDEVYTTERTDKSIMWSDISDPLIRKQNKWLTLLPETEWNGTDEIEAGNLYLSIDQDYNVMWDGTSYTCTCMNDDMFTPCIGNRALRSEYDTDTGEPFCVAIGWNDAGTAKVFDIRAETSGTHTIGIETQAYVPAPLDEGYIPDTIQRVGGDVILNSSTEGSTKQFKITVDDSGTLSAVEVTE